MSQIMTPQQVYNVKRQIALSGQFVAFTRQGENQYHEPTGTAEIVHSCKGLFHVSGSHLSITLEEAGTTQERKRPRVLIEYTDTIRIKDAVAIGGTTYEVSGIENIGNAGVFLDVSLGGDIDD